MNPQEKHEEFTFNLAQALKEHCHKYSPELLEKCSLSRLQAFLFNLIPEQKREGVEEDEDFTEFEYNYEDSDMRQEDRTNYERTGNHLYK